MHNIHKKIELDNIKLRTLYLSRYRCYSTEEITTIRGLNKDQYKQLSQEWKRNKIVFSIMDNELELYPCFQFHNGKPIEIMSLLLKMMPSDITSWQIALWFSTKNIYLDEQLPQECLSLNKELIFALKQESQNIFG